MGSISSFQQRLNWDQSQRTPTPANAQSPTVLDVHRCLSMLNHAILLPVTPHTMKDPPFARTANFHCSNLPSPNMTNPRSPRSTYLSYLFLFLVWSNDLI